MSRRVPRTLLLLFYAWALSTAGSRSAGGGEDTGQLHRAGAFAHERIKGSVLVPTLATHRRCRTPDDLTRRSSSNLPGCSSPSSTRPCVASREDGRLDFADIFVQTLGLTILFSSGWRANGWVVG